MGCLTQPGKNPRKDSKLECSSLQETFPSGDKVQAPRSRWEERGEKTNLDKAVPPRPRSSTIAGNPSRSHFLESTSQGQLPASDNQLGSGARRSVQREPLVISAFSAAGHCGAPAVGVR